MKNRPKTFWLIVPVAIITIGFTALSLTRCGSDGDNGGGGGIDNEKETDSENKLGPNNEVPGDTLKEQLFWLACYAESGKAYTLTARADEDIGSSYDLGYIGNSDIIINLIGSGEEKVLTSSSNCIFSVGKGGTLILNKNITLQGSSNFTIPLWVSENGTLVMNEGVKIIGGGASNGVYMSQDGATFIMNGGEITGFGNAVYMFSNSTFTMEGGTISGNNKTYNHGSVFIRGENAIFTMNGGTISDNTNTNNASGVEVYEGTFIMNNGKISGNTAQVGGGVYVSDNAEFVMNGGEISGNRTNTGGGVRVYGTFTMNGGEIYGNTADVNGGGVTVGDKGTFRISNGIIYGSDADTSKANISPPTTIAAGALILYNGASLFIYNNGIAQYGMETTWTDIPVNKDLYTSTRETTIKVVNGMLQ